MTLANIFEEFRAAMREHEIDIRDPIEADGQLHRAHVEGDRPHSKNAWYILHLDEHPAGSFGCWKRHAKSKFSWTFKGKETTPWTPEQRQAYRAKLKRRSRDREQAERERHDEAAARAEAIWETSETADDDHPYLQRKACKPHGIRVGRWEVTSPKTGEITAVSNLALLIPIRDTRKKIWSLQAIFPHDRNPLQRDKDYSNVQTPPIR